MNRGCKFIFLETPHGTLLKDHFKKYTQLCSGCQYPIAMPKLIHFPVFGSPQNQLQFLADPNKDIIGSAASAAIGIEITVVIDQAYPAPAWLTIMIKS